MENRKWTVYVHINKINGKKYVGITSRDVHERWDNGNGYYRQRFYKSIQKYGWDNFKHEIIAENLTESEAKSLEVLYIGMWNTKDRKYGYNLTNGGDGACGYKHSNDRNKKISEKLKGNSNFKGHKHTEESKEKIRKSLSGRKRPKEIGEKVSNALKGKMSGRKLSEDTKRKISETRIEKRIGVGSKLSDEHKLKISKNSKSARKVICLNTGEVFNSMVECAKEFNTRRENVYTWLHGVKNRKGYVFMYYDDYISNECGACCNTARDIKWREMHEEAVR